MFKRQQTSAPVMDNTEDLDEFARSVVKAALAQLETVGRLTPFVIIERGDAATAHPLTAEPVEGPELVSLLDVARAGLKSLGRDVTRYALVWPGKVIDGATIEAVFVECAAQGSAAAAVMAVCHWRDPEDGELTTDLELRRFGSAPIRPDWT